jgi:DNA-binding PadR family transcriptional regulator
MPTPARLTVARRLLKKGAIKFLLLKQLESKPMHGYELAREVSAMFGGAYEPSPGVVYPTLQWLADQFYVTGVEAEGKTVYTITASGRKFLHENATSVKEAVDLASSRGSGQDFPILRSARRLERTIRVYLPEMSASRRTEVAEVLEEARRRIERMMQE